MTSSPDAAGIITPRAIITTVLGFFIGAVSLAYNPFLLVSLLALALCVLSLQSAARIDHRVVQGVTRIFAVLGIMGALGGIMVLIFPGLGVGGYAI